MKTKLMTLLTALTVVVFLSSCGKVPQAEIDAANAAIDSAKAIGADIYVTADFNALQDSMNSVNQMVEAQNGKMFKNYQAVSAQLVVVNQLATDVLVKTEVRKGEIKAEIATLQEEVAALNTQNNELVAQAPAGKEGAAALEAIKGDISTVDVSMAEVSNLVGADQLMPALDKAKAAKEKAVALNTELNEVIAKYSKGKKK